MVKIVFFGNTKYSLIGLRIVHDKLGVSHIVTIPDSPVGKFAVEQNISITMTKKLDDEFVRSIKKLEPDFLIVEDYGLILPNELLSIPKYAALNIHHSLLPRYRGPSPAPSAILNGEKISGITIIKMTEQVDAGDILAQQEYKLKPNETTDSLLTVLNSIGAELLLKVVSNYIKGGIKLSIQDHSKATYTEHLTRQSGYIDFSNKLEIENKQSFFLRRKRTNWKLKIERAVRAYYPWPGVWFKTKLGEQTRIVKLLPEQKIQVEGKKPMSYKDFVNGYKEGETVLSKLGLF